MKFIHFFSVCAFAGIFSVLFGMAVAPSEKTVSFEVPAITDTGKGELVNFKLQLSPGSGKTLVNINDAIFNRDVEYSLQKARRNAESFLGTNLILYDITATVSGQREVDGESAGVMLTVAIISGVLQKDIRKDIAISAVVGEGGEAIPVGGIEEKLFAAIDHGKTIFLVARSQNIKYEDEFQKKIKIIRIDSAGDAAKIALT